MRAASRAGSMGTSWSSRLWITCTGIDPIWSSGLSRGALAMGMAPAKRSAWCVAMNHVPAPPMLNPVTRIRSRSMVWRARMSSSRKRTDSSADGTDQRRFGESGATMMAPQSLSAGSTIWYRKGPPTLPPPGCSARTSGRGSPSRRSRGTEMV